MDANALGRILVTGAGGFIGGHLVAYLAAAGVTPVVAARMPPVSGTGPDARPERRGADLTAPGAPAALLDDVRPDTLFHLAGTRGAGAASPAAACAALNICAAVELLEAAAAAGVRRVVLVGSAEEYGDQPGPLVEDMPLRPVSAYGISKAAATRFALFAHAECGCPAVVLRPFTVYGPGQPGHMFLSQAVAAAVVGRPFNMTSGRQRRDLVHVDDMVRALIAAAIQPGVEGAVINVGSGEPVALRELAERVWRLSGSEAPLRIGRRPLPSAEAHDTWADIGRARRLLGWAPAVDLDTGLRAVIDAARAREEG